jgi:protein-S-isoprenylcysteine O-methyltransferase Ste14
MCFHFLILSFVSNLFGLLLINYTTLFVALEKEKTMLATFLFQDDTNVVAYLTYMNNTKDLIILGMNVILYTIF